MGVSSRVSGDEFSSDRAQFEQLLLACLDPAAREDAERQLRKAETSCPVGFVTTCAEELGDASRPVLARQLAGLLFANSFSLGYPLAESWPEEVPGSTRVSIHEALLNAVKSKERAVWSSAATAIAKIALIEVPLGLWPDLMSCLHQWAKGDVIKHNDCLHEAALLIMKCLAEAWPLERIVPGMISAAAEGLAPVFQQHIRVLAAETLLQMLEASLEFSSDTIPRCPDIVVEAILSGCQVAEAPQLQITSFSCLDQFCQTFLPYVANHRERIFSVGLAGMRASHRQVKAVVMDMWSTLATNQFLMMTSHDDRSGLYSRLIPELMLLVLESICSEDIDDEANSVVLPARTLLAAMCAASHQTHANELASFASAHVFSPDVRFRRAAFVAMGAFAPNHTPDVPMEAILDSLQSPPLCSVACWAVGRMVEFSASGISADVKLQLFTLSLQGIADATYAEDFQYILFQLLQASTVTPAQYVDISRRFIQVSLSCPPVARGIVLAALSCLIKRAPADCKPHFADTVTSLLTLSRELQLIEFRQRGQPHSIDAHAVERRVCWDGAECTFEEFKQYYGKTAVKNWCMSPKADHAVIIDGVARCLNDLAKCLGNDVPQVAESLMAYYIANFQATCSQGSGLDEDTMYAVGSLGAQLGPAFINIAGPYSELWPLLLHGMGAPAATRYDLAGWDFPLSCEASLTTFCQIVEALGQEFAHCWYVENSRAVLQRVLSVWYLSSRLRSLAVIALGRLVLAVAGVLESIPQVFYTMRKLVASLPTFTVVRTKFSPSGLQNISVASVNQGKRTNSSSVEPLSHQVWNHGLHIAILQAYTDICNGVRRLESLAVLTHDVPSILDFAIRCLENPTESGTQSAALKLIALLVDLFPEYRDTVFRFQEQLDQFPDVDPVASLESKLQKCMIAG